MTMQQFRQKLRTLSLCVALATAHSLWLSPVRGAGWEDEQWIVEPFTQSLGGGPDTGPVMETGDGVHSLCGDANGGLYLAQGQIIDIVTADGIRRHLAGSGEPGFKDGPAPQAQFRLGFQSYYGAFNIACGPGGTIYVADGGNRRIRRIHRRDDAWFVDTWAGGGNRTLRNGQTAAARDITFRGTMAVALNSRGNVIIATDWEAYRVSADGTSVTQLGGWPTSAARKAGEATKLNVVMGDADEHGNVYFVSRTPNVVIKIDPQGTITHVAGVTATHGDKRRNRGDTLPREAFFHTPSSLVANPDGSAVYVCGGDEYDIRHVPTDGETHTATLMQNGRWYRASIHPRGRAFGAAVVDPKAVGRLKPDGNLSVLLVSHLAGRDATGNLYGILLRWRGMTQYVMGRGLLPTRVFRLQRIRSEKRP